MSPSPLHLLQSWFYTGRDWTSRGSVIRYNLVHHVEDSREGCGSATRFVHNENPTANCLIQAFPPTQRH